MATYHDRPFAPQLLIWTFVAWICLFTSTVLADDTDLIPYSTDEGTVYLEDNRQPALYTGDFGDCQGNSLVNLTRFDASLYRDNLTVMFHMAGSTALQQEHVMIYFSVFAYGENRFNLTFNPCTINIPTMCPLDASKPIEANGLLPIGADDLAGIPTVAFSIPDFEGQAILRLFSNVTHTQIACYSAVMKNGHSFSHPVAVGTVLGVFTVIALLSSAAVTIYGHFVPETRMHYAHSMSTFVVFSVLQHIFFTGSLSMDWPSVLVAFWSNYAWSAGMIYSRKMQDSINQFIGNNRGNISAIGAAPSNQDFVSLGGGVSLSQIFTRDVRSVGESDHVARTAEHMLQRRSLVNSSTGFDWYGDLVGPGLPLPGNYSGFAGTLATLNIPASNAFLTGLIWFLVLAAIVGSMVVAAKWFIELLARLSILRTSRMDHFRTHWVHFTGSAILRTCYIGFFMIVYLTLFQFALGGGKNVIALAAVVLIILLTGIFGYAGYAVWYRLHHSKFRLDADKLQVVSKKHGHISWYGLARESSEKVNEPSPRVVRQLPWWQPHFVDGDEGMHVHDNPDYVTRFGWMSARFRRSRWWFFSVWLIYELVRACFYGGAAGHPLVQVFGLLAWEAVAFIATMVMKPFESNRLNLVMVYLLGFSKVATVALSSAFDPRFGLNRIMTTVVGVIVIVIQGLLTICLMLAIVIGAVSTYMSLTRNHEAFKPASWNGLRTRYFAHIQQKATDKPLPPLASLEADTTTPKEPYFAVSAIRREPKIEDEDSENVADEEASEVEHSTEYRGSLKNVYKSRTESVRSSDSHLPRGAKSAHRRSWSIQEATQSTEHIQSGLSSRMSMENISEMGLRYQTSSFQAPPQQDISALHGANWQTQKHRRARSTSNPHFLVKNRRSLRSSGTFVPAQAEGPYA